MLIREISDMPIVIDANEHKGNVHESVLRSYHIVRKVRNLLSRGTPGNVVIELIDEMGSPHVIEPPCEICDPDAEKAIERIREAE